MMKLKLFQFEYLVFSLLMFHHARSALATGAFILQEGQVFGFD